MKTGTVLLFFFLTPLFWAQSKKEAVDYKSVSHTVVSGESVLSISKHYGINPDVVYRNNRFVLDSIKEGMVLTFPAPIITVSSVDEAVILQNESLKDNEQTLLEVEAREKTSLQSTPTAIFHKVQSGETLYGLSKKYVCTVEEIKKWNPKLQKLELKVGEVLSIPVRGTVVESPTIMPTYKSGQTIQHIVKPKETLYGLSKKYGVSIAAIQNQNKTILKNGLQVNQTLLITIN